MLVQIKLRGKYRVPGQAIKVELFEVGTLVEYEDSEYAQWLIDGGYVSSPQSPDETSGTKIVSVPDEKPELPAISAGLNLEQAGKIGKTKARRK